MLSVNAMLNHPDSASGPVPAHHDFDTQPSPKRGDHERAGGPMHTHEHRSERGQSQETAYFSISDYEDDPNSRFKKRKFYSTVPPTTTPGPGPSSVYAAGNHPTTDRYASPSQLLIRGTLPRHSAEDEGGTSFVGDDDLENDDIDLRLNLDRVRVRNSSEMTRYPLYQEDAQNHTHIRSVSASVDHRNRDRGYVRSRGYTASSISSFASGIPSSNKSLTPSRFADLLPGTPDNNRIAEYCSNQLAERAKLAEIQASKEASRAPLPRLTPIRTSNFTYTHDDTLSRHRLSSGSHVPPASSSSSSSSYALQSISPQLPNGLSRSYANKQPSRTQPLSPPSSVISMPTPSPPLQPIDAVRPKTNYARRATYLSGISPLDRGKSFISTYTNKLSDQERTSPPAHLRKEMHASSSGASSSSSKSRLGRKEPPNDLMTEDEESRFVAERKYDQQQVGPERARKRSKSFAETSVPPSMQISPAVPLPPLGPLSVPPRARGRSSPPPRSSESSSTTLPPLKGPIKRIGIETLPSIRSAASKSSAKSSPSESQALPNEPGYEKYINIGSDYYKCMEDEEILHTRRTVMRHEEIHQGKRVECQYCFAKVSRRDAMLRHQRNTCTMIPPHLKERM
ncbi:hypothetical protein PNOK_0709800 [Pyrrhoderma noxium]|uniref:C2H2-type domain-containing protein n=1 Tax=Pyrrhoderma noxium TaxID=2282107 RepID=A0A286UBX7_9AGAM|nr:hypothetical protein PNOK_0709800 [Pyrrhoderma noxium]